MAARGGTRGTFNYTNMYDIPCAEKTESLYVMNRSQYGPMVTENFDNFDTTETMLA